MLIFAVWVQGRGFFAGEVVYWANQTQQKRLTKALGRAWTIFKVAFHVRGRDFGTFLGSPDPVATNGIRGETKWALPKHVWAAGDWSVARCAQNVAVTYVTKPRGI